MTTSQAPAASQPVIIPIDTPSLGDRSYLLHDGSVAVVVDPQRDIDRVLALADEHRVRITHVLETHIHNDYVTGGLALAQRTGASYHVNAEDDVAFERTPIRDGNVIEISPTMRLRAIATPGHTFTHLSYALEATTKPDSQDVVAIFTGGALLYGTTGRPDLLGHEHTHDLVHHQFDSAHRLAQQLPDRAEVLPTHGFGSFCSPGSSGSATSSTIGQEKRSNPVLTRTQQDWVEQTLADLEAYPAYYAHMGSANSAGPLRAGPHCTTCRRPGGHRRQHQLRAVGRRPANPHRVRRGPRHRHPQHRDRRTVRDLPRLAHPRGTRSPSSGRAPSRSPRPSASSSGSGSTTSKAPPPGRRRSGPTPRWARSIVPSSPT